MDDSLDRFRGYLLLVARLNMDERLRAEVDPSDLVQQTLLDAHRMRGKFEGNEQQLRAWLRRILAINLLGSQRAARYAQRKVRLRDLRGQLDRSASRLEDWLEGETSSPSLRLRREEKIEALASALEGLPESQRDALTLRHCQGLSLLEISEKLGKTPDAVAGLLKRGLAHLRTTLDE